jgi:ABC-type multidrug transport system fused ATPase/permease subunit
MTPTTSPKNKNARRTFSRETFIKGVRVISNELSKHKKLLIVLSVFGLVDATAQAFVPLISGKIFDAIIGISKNNLTPLIPVFTLIGVWLFLQLGDNAVSWWSGIKKDTLSNSLGAGYTASAFSKLLEMPLSFHATTKQGDVTDRVNRAAGGLDNIVGSVLLNLLPNFLSIIVAVFITLFINIELTLVLFVAIAIYVAILWRSIPRFTDLQRKSNRAYNRAYGDLYDTFNNVREVKQAATEREEQQRLHTNFLSRASRFWVEMNNAYQQLNFYQKMLITATQLALFALSIFFVRNGTMTPGELVAFNAYAAMIFGPFVMLGQQWQSIQNSIVAIVRADGILSSRTEVYAPKKGIALDKLAGTVEFRNVSFTYKGGAEVLKDISFIVHPGQRIALVGESGMGKTTMMDLLSGFYFPQSGGIFVDGVDVRKLNLRKYRSRIGVVPQEPTLFNDTIMANIRYGNPGRSREEVFEAARKAFAHDFIERFPFKYRQIVGWRGVKLSIGQKQRIALARAFLRNPDILVLDEPTSALDARSEDLIKNSLEELMMNRTTFIIAHRLSTVREADMILVLKEGRIAEYGKHHELLGLPEGIYKSLYDLQIGGVITAGSV